MSSRPVRSLITVLMDVLVVVAVVLTVRLVLAFFGALASQEWAEAALSATRFLVIPVGIDDVRTPYGGVFEVDAALSIGAILLVEWVLTMVRRQA